MEKLNEYYNNGLLKREYSEEYGLYIWNYTEKVQFENLWDDITIQCRGLITDTKGNIITKSFNKFFNLEEDKYNKDYKNFNITKKLDGSMGILFYYNNNWIFTTRSSFVSDQCIYVKNNILPKYDLNLLDKAITYIFEIIYPENLIVVKYDFRDIILIGVFKDLNEIELPDCQFKKVEKCNYSDFKDLAQLDIDNEEGFVVKFDNGDRCKIKFAKYLELHRIRSNLSTKTVYEAFCNNSLQQLIDSIQDEFYNIVKDYYKELEEEYEIKYNYFKDKFESLPKMELKEFCLYLKEDVDFPYLICLFKNKQDKLKKLLLKLIEPKWRLLCSF